MCRFLFACWMAASVAALAVPGAAYGQGAGDLFGDSSVGAAATEKAQPSGPPPLIVRQLMGRASRSNIDLAASVHRLSRLARWGEVNQLLSRLSIAEIPPTVRSEMARKIGSAEILRIQLEPSLSAQADANLSALAAALAAESQSPVLLARAAQGLLSSSKDQQLASARILFAGGNAAVSAIAGELTRPHSRREREILIGALTRIDKGALEAVQQLALYASPDRRVGAIESLAQTNDQRFLLDMLTGAFATDASDQERQVAFGTLSRWGQAATTSAEAMAVVASLHSTARKDAANQTRDQQTQTRWVVEGSDDHVLGIETNQFVQARRRVVDLGNRLRRLGQLTPVEQRQVFAGELEYRVALDGEWGSPDEIELLAGLIDWRVDESFLLATLHDAVGTTQDDLAGASDLLALGLVRWIDAVTPQATSPAWQPHRLVQSSGGDPSPLVRLACQSPSTRVRYEAALLVSRIAGPGQYPGSSRVRRTLAEMSRLRDRPEALLVETQVQVAERLIAVIEQLGYRVSVVSNVGQLLRAIDRGGDFRIVVSKMQLADFPPIELVDRVRRVPSARRLPIIFYGPESQQLQAMINQGRWKAATTQIESIASVAAFDSINQTSAQQEQLLPLAGDERRMMRRLAIERLNLPTSR